MSRLSTLLIAILAPVTFVYAQDQDTIVRSDGKPIPPLTITQDDYLTVSGKHVVEIKVPSYLVKDVVYGGESPDFLEGMQRLREGRNSSAAMRFKDALDAAGEQRWALELYNYHLADVLFIADKFAGFARGAVIIPPPSTCFKRALDASPKSRFMLDIIAKLPVCLAGEQDFDAADAALKDGERRLAAYVAETTATHDPGYVPAAQRARAALSLAAARVLQKKAEAKKADWKAVCDAWHDACQKATAFVDLSQTAQRGSMHALLQAQDIGGAREKAEEIIRKLSSDPDSRQWNLLSSAWLVQARIQFDEALAAEKSGRALQSQHAFADARWSAIYAIEGSDCAQARLLAGRCCDKLQRVEEDGAEKAVRYWKEVLRENPDGEFANAARDELKKGF